MTLRIRAAYVVMILLILATAAVATAFLAGYPWMEPAQAVPGLRGGAGEAMPKPNVNAKRDRLVSRQPEPADLPLNEPASLSLETARQFLAAPPLDIWSEKPAASAKPSTILLDDRQIASIKARLKLTKAQLEAWPPVEKALRDLVALLHDRRKQRPEKAIDLDSDVVKRLAEVGRPFFAKLRADQRNEVQSLARMVGLASALPTSN